jgi:hypothetical protein
VEEASIVEELARKLASSGYRTRDLSRPWGFFFGIRGLALGDLSVPRPDFLPEALKTPWERGLQACRAKAGRRPWKGKQHAFLCGRELARVMWQRLLDHLEPEWVMVVEGHLEGAPSTDLGVRLFRPAATTERTLTASGIPAKDLAARAHRMLLDLLAGKGEPKPRLLLRSLPKAPTSAGTITAELAEGTAHILPAVEIPAGCDATVPALRLSPGEAPLAQTIDGQWTRTIAGRRKAGTSFDCSLSVTLSRPIMAGTSMRRVDAFLQCKSERFNVGVPSISAGHAIRGLSPRMVKKLLEHFCR